MFVWYVNKQGKKIRFFVQANIYQETAINTEMKANIYSQDGSIKSEKFDILTENGRKYFVYKNEQIFFDDFVASTAEDFVARLAKTEVEPAEVYATLERESTRLQFKYNNKIYVLNEAPHLRKNLGRKIHLINGSEQVTFFMDEFCLYLNAKEIVPSLR